MDRVFASHTTFPFIRLYYDNQGFLINAFPPAFPSWVVLIRTIRVTNSGKIPVFLRKWFWIPPIEMLSVLSTYLLLHQHHYEEVLLYLTPIWPPVARYLRTRRLSLDVSFLGLPPKFCSPWILCFCFTLVTVLLLTFSSSATFQRELPSLNLLIIESLRLF